MKKFAFIMTALISWSIGMPAAAQFYGERVPLKQDKTGSHPVSVMTDGTGKRTIQLQNDWRAEHRLSALTEDDQLTKAAAVRAQELAKGHYTKHQRENGEPWHTVLRKDVPITFRIAGENLASISFWGEDKEAVVSAEYWIEQWKKSPSHSANMLHDGYQRVGFSSYSVSEHGITTVYAVMLFAG